LKAKLRGVGGNTTPPPRLNQKSKRKINKTCSHSTDKKVSKRFQNEVMKESNKQNKILLWKQTQNEHKKHLKNKLNE
jgi:hypothetical protein